MRSVLVTGATGTLGRSLLARPAAGGYRVRAASRHAPAGAAGSVAWTSMDLVTGRGIDEAVAGVDVIIHAASAPKGDTAATDVAGTERLAAAAARAGVEHLLYVSIVGIERTPVAYYRHKLGAERIVQRGAVPWSILRGTQFHDLMDVWCGALGRLPISLVPRGWLAQPFDVADFADALWRGVADGPRGRAPDVAGPEVLTWHAMLDAWQRARGRPRRIFDVPIPGRLSAGYRRGDATAPAGGVHGLTWRGWLARKYSTSAAGAPD